MKQTFVQKFKKARLNKRPNVLIEMRDKNIAFLKPRNPQLAEIISHRGGDYHVNISGDFFNISNRRTGQVCHPADKLEQYMAEFGAWHHTGWIDKIKMEPRAIPEIDHGMQVIKFLDKVFATHPEIAQRIGSGIVSLPRLADKRRFSGITVFLGTYTSLHIIHYLNNTEIRNLVIIEPDLDRFALSCFFIDYAAIEKRFKGLVMHIGPDMPENVVNFLTGKATVTGSAWMRILPAYPSDDFERLINRFELQWRALSEIFVPYDREVRNLCYGVRNLENGLPINYKRPTLSENSRIALVASGPSLDKDLEWLKANQDKLIIFAAHSSIYTLKQNGIRPDYQCSLDTELSEDLIEKLHLDPDIPLVSYYKATPESLAKFHKVLLINEVGKANPVFFQQALSYTHPTTGNLTLATIIHAQPKQLFLVGLDLGFRDVSRDHTVGFWNTRDLNEEELAARPVSADGILLEKANFADSEGQIYTKSYYNAARKAIEAGLTQLPNTTILNVSDGIKLAGAEPKHSAEINLDVYPEKQADIEAFEASFSNDHETDDAWQIYKIPGAEMLETLKTGVIEAVSLKKFEWMRFSEALDNAWSQAYGKTQALDPERFDFRAEAYAKLIQDLLTEWYRLMVFTKTAKESEKLYQDGLQVLSSVLDGIEWPAELTEFEQRYLDADTDTTQTVLEDEALASESVN